MILQNLDDPNTSLPPSTQGTARSNVIKAKIEISNLGYDSRKVPAVIDCDGSKGHYCINYSPCITASRGAGGGHWLMNRGRRQNLREMIRLMGVKVARVQDVLDEETISQRKLGHCIGNAVPVTLISRIYERLLPAIGFKLPKVLK